MNFSRPEQLQELGSRSEFDLLIIGGGIVGSAALEMAASSGLSSILLEKMILHQVHPVEVQNSYTAVLGIFLSYSLA